MSAVGDLLVERRGWAGSAGRRRTNFALFLGPAIALSFLFFVIPVLIDIAVSFTDLDRTLRISKFTAEQYQKVFEGDRRLPQVIGLTFVYAFGTLAVFNVTFGLVLALTTTELNKISGGFFRGVWLLPRMSPSVAPAESGGPGAVTSTLPALDSRLRGCNPIPANSEMMVIASGCPSFSV